MLSILLKLMPMGIVAGGVATSQEKFEPLVHYVQTVMVEFEMSSVGKCLKLDSIDGSALPNQSQFADYIRKNMDVKEGSKRDPSTDLWGQPYKIFYKEEIASIVSAGPDLKFETADDVVHQERLRKQ